MSEVLQANVFFFITALAVVVATFFVCVALYYVVRILRTIDRVMRRIDEKSSMLANDLTHMRAYIAQGGLVRSVSAFVARMMRRSHRRAQAGDEALSEE